jgi:hypothetical protein
MPEHETDRHLHFVPLLRMPPPPHTHTHTVQEQLLVVTNVKHTWQRCLRWPPDIWLTDRNLPPYVVTPSFSMHVFLFGLFNNELPSA